MREDRRKAWRFPVLQEQRSAELRVGDASLTVRLVDQSATGFLIECDRHPGVYAGENVWLQTSLGWTEVKVIKVRHEIDGTRIGLERLADVCLDVPSSTGVIKRDALTHEAPYHSPWPTIVMVAALLGVMAFLAWIAYDRHGSERFLESLHGSARDKTANSTPAAAIQREAERRKQEVEKSIKEFGVALMALPDMVERLGLSQDQLTQLRRILSETVTSEQQLRSRGLAAAELRQQLAALYEQATEQATGLLTSEQSTAWRQMYAEALERLKRDESPRVPQ